MMSSNACSLIDTQRHHLFRRRRRRILKDVNRECVAKSNLLQHSLATSISYSCFQTALACGPSRRCPRMSRYAQTSLGTNAFLSVSSVSRHGRRCLDYRFRRLCRRHHGLCGRRRLLRSHHAVLHQPLGEGTVHHFQAPRIAHHLPPEVGPADDGPRVPNADPDGLAPRRDGLRRPVVRHNLLQDARAPHDARVLLDRDEVRVRPLAVEIVERLALRLCELWRLLALTPRGDHDAPARLEHASHLLDVLGLVRHVLARLASPHKVERVVRVLHVEGVNELELDVAQTAFLCERCRALLLLRRDGDPGDAGLRELLGQVTASAADAAANVEDARGRRRNLGEGEHLVDEVILSLDEVLAAVERTAALSFLVIPQVNVLAPVVLKNAFACPRVVLPSDCVCVTVIHPRGRVQNLHKPHEQSSDDGGNNGRFHR
mmetsp:Transcript_53270/g.116197  ORF Transcript_53270/g.116197 Transcript_53270/m.116197 type:complete len:431 (+) Transcript_53270:428-1720(+)